jgi:hypothetical protein
MVLSCFGGWTLKRAEQKGRTGFNFLCLRSPNGKILKHFQELQYTILMRWSSTVFIVKTQ